MASNRVLALDARDRLASALGIAPPAPDTMLGAMAALPLPVDPSDSERARRIQAGLVDEGVEAPIIGWPVRAAQRDERPEAWLVRVSMQAYDDLDDVERLAEGLERELGAA